MGFFSRLFKTEKKEEPVYPIETVPIEHLQEWFLKKTKNRFKDIEKDLSSSFSVLRKQADQFKDSLKNLKDAKLHNPDIPEREVQIMDGNRNAYLQQSGIFLSNLDVPEEINYRTALDFVDEFKESLKTLASATAKNSQKLRYFFENNISEVNKKIKIMNDEVQSMHDLLNDEERGVTYVDQVHDKIEDFIAKCKHRQELKGKIVEENVKLGNSKKLRDKMMKETENIKSRKEYSDFERLNTQRDGFVNDIKQIENDLHHVFAQIDKALRKYERLATENVSVISDYNTDSAFALAKDKDLVIINVLSSMKNSIENGALEMKESDKEKTLQRLGNINKEFLQNFMFRYEDLKKSKKKIDDQVKNNSLLRQLDDLAYKIRHSDEQISRAEETIADYDEKIEKLGVKRLKEDLEHELRLMTQSEIKIELDKKEAFT